MAINTRRSVAIKQRNFDKYGYNNANEAIKEYYDNYPMRHFRTLPEFAIEKLDLNEDAIDSIPSNPEERTREQIRDWMKSNLSLSDIMWIGW